MKRTLSRYAAWVIVGVIAALPAKSLAQDETTLAGQWRLVVERSDDVGRAIRTGSGAVARVVGVRDPDERVVAALLGHIQRDASELELTFTEETATVITGDGTVVVYGTEDRGSAVLAPGVEAQTTAEWAGAELRVLARIFGGGRIEERYSVDDGGLLRVEVRLLWPDRAMNVRFRRIYQRPVGPAGWQ